MRALLIDDERLARVELRRLLSAHPQIDIVGEAGSAAEARDQIAALQPDLLFLDVEMPGASGFDLVDQLTADSAKVPAVLFTTAFEHYAVRAFEVRAIDYLLKPIQAARLSEALTRLSEAKPPERPAVPLQQLYVRSGERAWIVRTTEIRLIEAEGNYARLHFGTESPIILRSLQTLHERLDSNFFRANRSQIVNLRAIARMDLAVDGAVCATLKDGTAVTFSRRQSQLLREQMMP